MKTGKKQLKKVSNAGREQKVLWLLLLARAPARGDEKPQGLAERGCSVPKKSLKKRRGKKGELLAENQWRFGQSVDSSGRDQRRGGDHPW